MKMKILLIVLVLVISINSAASPPSAKTDSLLNILKINDQHSREKKLIDYLRIHFQQIPENQLAAEQASFSNFFLTQGIPNRLAYQYYVESVCQRRLKHPDAAENALLRAIDFAGRGNDHYLSLTFLNFLAYRQTEEGNSIGAVSNYRLAKREAGKIDDPYLQVMMDINISDIYYKIDLNNQSLFHLRQAEAIINRSKDENQRLKINYQHIEDVLNYNKSENFFRMNKPDSLAACYLSLQKSPSRNSKLYTYKKRISYYLYLLNHRYAQAASLINQLHRDSSFQFSEADSQNLADAYAMGGQPDSASAVISRLLNDPLENNHPEIKVHLYEVLGDIALTEHNTTMAASDFKLSLQQAKENTYRLAQVGNISSLIKMDEMEASYIQKNENYERELIWLIFLIIVAALIIIIFVMINWNIKQKRHYEKLLFAAKKEELAYINSHDVRRHLTNILGLIEVVRQSQSRYEEYAQAEDRLFYSAEELDKAIKNIAEKLDN